MAKSTDTASLVPDSYLDELKERADIEAIINARVPLKRAGTSLVACCPFHKENSPSFTVSPQKGFYHCFGCGASGSAITFLMEHDGMPFRDAVTEAAQGCGMALPAEMLKNASGPTPDYAPLYKTNETAYRWFRAVLRNDAHAKNYLKGRGMTSSTLKRFLIGSAPDAWQGLGEAFEDYGSNEHLVTTGLVRVNEETKRRYDSFRARVIFGIRDPRGRVIGFGGRVTGPSDAAKYINSPESPVFDKSSVLFGLYEAKEDIRREGFAIVTEGYMDVAMLAQFGVTNAVAGMGTAFTRIQAERLLTQTKSIVFCFDGDKAGQKAAMKACATMLPLLTEAMDVRVLVLPDGKDPDEMVRSEGKEAFLALAKAAPTMVPHILSALGREHNTKSPEGKARIIGAARPLVLSMTHPTLRESYLQMLSQFVEADSASMSACAAPPAWASKNQATLWLRLAEAATFAPAHACEFRDAIIDCLDDENPDEALLIRILNEQRAGGPSTASPSQIMAAEDILSNAVDLILEDRNKAYSDELTVQYNQNQIDLATYLKLSMRMG